MPLSWWLWTELEPHWTGSSNQVWTKPNWNSPGQRPTACQISCCGPASNARNAGKQQCRNVGKQQCSNAGCRGALLLTFFRKKGAALGSIWAVNTILILPPSRRHAPDFHFSRSKKSVLFLNDLWLAKCFQNPSKMTPKTCKKASKNWCFFASSFSNDFLSNFACFRSRPTHDFTAIYNTFVGCTIFRAVKKVPTKSFKKTPKIHAKSLLKTI